jgi:hypothetical protein
MNTPDPSAAPQKQLKTPFPTDPREFVDLIQLVKTYLLPGYAPPEPILPAKAATFTIGSCFAQHIAQHLHDGQRNVFLGFVPEGVNTPGQSHVFMDMVLNGEKNEARHKLETSDLFVLTAGVALQCFVGDEERYEDVRIVIRDATWRMLTVPEIAAHIRGIIHKARSVNPGIHVVLTLSPIPLKKSVGHLSAIGQDCLSKSLLRTAIESVLAENIPNVTYWPSFEIVRWIGGHMGPFFGVAGTDHRHVHPGVLDAIMNLFVETYFAKETAYPA